MRLTTDLGKNFKYSEILCMTLSKNLNIYPLYSLYFSYNIPNAGIVPKTI